MEIILIGEYRSDIERKVALFIKDNLEDYTDGKAVIIKIVSLA